MKSIHAIYTFMRCSTSNVLTIRGYDTTIEQLVDTPVVTNLC